MNRMRHKSPNTGGAVQPKYFSYQISRKIRHLRRATLVTKQAPLAQRLQPRKGKVAGWIDDQRGTKNSRALLRWEATNLNSLTR